MNKNALAAGVTAAALLALAGCSDTSARAPRAQAPVAVVKPSPAKTAASPVIIRTAKNVRIEFIGNVFRVQYTAKNTTKVTSDFLISFEYRDKSGVRIGDGVDSVSALAPGQTAKQTYDNYGSDGFKLSDVRTVRVTKVDSWPSL